MNPLAENGPFCTLICQALPADEVETFTAFTFLMAVESADGTLVAKFSQPGYGSRKLLIDVGRGVDVVAVVLCAAFVGAATGANVGGLAGAGGR